MKKMARLKGKMKWRTPFFSGKGARSAFSTEKTLEFGCYFLVNSKVIFGKNFGFVFVFFVSVFSICNSYFFLDFVFGFGLRIKFAKMGSKNRFKNF